MSGKMILNFLLILAFSDDSYCSWNSKSCSGPHPDESYDSFLKRTQEYISSAKQELSYKGGVFDKVPWTQTNTMHTQMHPYDRYFYDRDNGKYTVEKYLNDTITRYGGLDSLLLWPTYPQIGVDARNQYDCFRAMPGGLKELTDVVSQLHERGVKVLYPFNPWDQYTRSERVSDPEALVGLIVQTGADGFNGDTMDFISEDFWTEGIKDGVYIAMEPEGYGNEKSFNYETIGWAYLFTRASQQINPGSKDALYNWDMTSDHAKLIDGRRMTHVTDRWCVNKTSPLHLAYFSGIGFNAWENVWGTFNTIRKIDGERIRRMAHILRYFSKSGHTTVSFPDWQPFYPTEPKDVVFSSLFTLDSPELGGKTQLLLFVNRDSQPQTVKVDLQKGEVSYIYDCWFGQLLDNTDSVHVNGLGFGCIFSTSEQPKSPSFAKFMQERRSLTTKPLSQFSTEFQGMPQKQQGRSSAIAKDTTSMSNIPQAQYKFNGKGIEVEGGDNWSDFQFTWENEPTRHHGKQMTIGPFLIDTHPVTNAQFQQYLLDTKYEPSDRFNFLRHWNKWEVAEGRNCYPNGNSTSDWSHGAIYSQCCSQNQHDYEPTLEDCQRLCEITDGCSCVTYERDSKNCFLRHECRFEKCDQEAAVTSSAINSTMGHFLPDSLKDVPVTYVSYNEAEAYCKWKGKRLPHAYEWQYAAQGTDGRTYPWGNDLGSGNCPTPYSGRQNPPPVEVGTFKKGASPFGVQDMFYHVWEYTDLFIDDHSIAVLLKGGSNYHPRGSMWYFPQPKSLTEHNKYFLMSDSFERAGTVGFRCVSDTSESQPAPYHYS